MSVKLTLSELKVNGLRDWVMSSQPGSPDAHDGALSQLGQSSVDIGAIPLPCCTISPSSQ